MTPYEAWHGRTPSVHHLRTFGCVAHVKKLGPGLHKLVDRSMPGIFVGYEEGAKAYRVFDPVGKRLYTTRDVAFEERRAWNWNARLTEAEEVAPPSFTMVYATSETVSPPPTMSSATPSPASMHSNEVARGATPAARPQPPVLQPTHMMVTRAQNGIFHSHLQYVVPVVNAATQDTPDMDEEEEMLQLVSAEEPGSAEEALAIPAWKKVMEEEMSCILDNKTWTLAMLPAGHRGIGQKWVFKLKKDPEGNVVKHKARLVVKGYAQRQGVNFDKVFAPVARMETVCVLLALAAHGGWQVHHIDVKSAFLNGELAEEVYMQQPPGFVDRKNPSQVLKLSKD